MKFFDIEVDSDGVALCTFDRPPVNAVSFEVYPDLRELAETLSADESVRCVVLTAPSDARAWCGGADLNDFLPLDYETRMARYALINECMPVFYNLDRPVIAAMNMHAVGVGLVIASFCDIRIASEDAFFAAPEIDRGVLAGGGAFFSRLNMPQGTIREMIFTGRRFSADEMLRAGFLNYAVAKAEVLDRSMEMARVIAHKSLPALKANKTTFNDCEVLSWQEGYKMTNPISAELTVGADAKEGIRAFLEKRSPSYSDR